MSLFDEWNKNKFNVYKREEKTVLGLMEVISNWIDKTIIKLDEVDRNTNKNTIEKLDIIDLNENYKLTKHNGANYEGKWFGLDKPTLSVEGATAQTEQNAKDIVNLFKYDFAPQGTIPPKIGLSTNNFKIIHKRENGEFLVIFKCNKGYVRVTLNTGIGVVADKDNYGENYGLLRVTDVRILEDVYLYKDMATPKSGALTSYTSPNIKANVIEQSLLNIGTRQDDRNISSKAGQLGNGIYQMTFNTEIAYDLNYTYATKGNISFMVSPTSVENVIIFINGKEVKRFNPRAFLNNGQLGYGKIEFDIPPLTTTSTYELKIRAEGASGYFYPSCINMYTLEEYNKQDVDNWKGFGSPKNGFLTQGANDYAFSDQNNKWFGSYHGGEISEICQITWNTTITPKLESTIYQENCSNINGGEFRILKDIQIFQKTDLISKIKMQSIFDFNLDGTINMKFSYTPYVDVLLNAFCTALTCTHNSFDHVFLPKYISFGNTPLNTDVFIPLTEGFVRQVNSIDKLQMDIRFTKFHENNNKKGAYILDHAYYRKFYYNVIINQKNVLIPTLQFSKSLDFSVR